MQKKQSVSSTRQKNKTFEPFKSLRPREKKLVLMDRWQFVELCGPRGILVGHLHFFLADRTKETFCYRQTPGGAYVRDYDATWKKIQGILKSGAGQAVEPQTLQTQGAAS